MLEPWKRRILTQQPWKSRNSAADLHFNLPALPTSRATTLEIEADMGRLRLLQDCGDCTTLELSQGPFGYQSIMCIRECE